MLSMTCADPGRAPLQFWRQRRTAGPPRRTGEAVRTADDRTEELDAPPETARVRVMDRDGEGPRLVLDRYRLLRRLGAGGFGVVWLAHDERLDRVVAVKRIATHDAAAGTRAEREAKAAARLAHPGIVALYESGRDDGAVYLVSELVRGRTLGELWRRARSPTATCCGSASRSATRSRTRTGAGSSTATSSPEHHGPRRPARRRGRREAHRLRRRADRGRGRAHAHRRRRRDARLHGPRAGRGPRRGRRGRPLRARARPLRGAGRRQPGARAGRGLHRAAGGRAAARARRGCGGTSRSTSAARSTAPSCRGPSSAARSRTCARALALALARRGGRGGDDRGQPARGVAEAADPAPRARPRRALLAAVAAPARSPPPSSPGSASRAAPPAPAAGAAAAALVAALPRAGWIASAAAARDLARAADQRPRHGASSSRRGRADRRPRCAGGAAVVGARDRARPRPRRPGGAWPALAGQAARPWHRLALGALGAWWLVLAEAVAGERLAAGPPRDMGAWQRSTQHAWTDVLVPIVTNGALLVAALWALAALVLPYWCAAGSSRWTSSARRSGPLRSVPRRRPWPRRCAVCRRRGCRRRSRRGRARRATWRGAVAFSLVASLRRPGVCRRPGRESTNPDERPAQPRGEAGRNRRRHVRPRLPHPGAAGRDRPQARPGDGRAQDRVGLAHLRPERVRRLAVARGPRAARGHGGRGHRRARRLPARARPPRAPRARSAARRSSSAPTSGSRSASSASRRGWSAPTREQDDAEQGDHGKTMVYSTAGRVQEELHEARTARARPRDGESPRASACRSARAAPSSAAAATATSSCRTRTSPAATPRSGPRAATAGRSPTSAPRTA